MSFLKKVCYNSKYKVGEKNMNKKSDPIAVIDSGMGGITVLRKLYKLMPNENYIYFGDSANAPYGIKTTDEIRDLTVEGFEMLKEMGAKAIVIACNTATSAAAAGLREKYPDFPIVGLEPAVKPAALSMEQPVVLVLATPLTLREKKYLKLVERFEGEATFIPLPAPELVRFIESGNLDSPEEIAYLEDILMPYAGNKVDAVVLGCTHFPFARRQIQRILGDEVLVFEGGKGAARQCRRLLENINLLADETQEGKITFLNSDESKISLCKQMFFYKG